MSYTVCGGRGGGVGARARCVKCVVRVPPKGMRGAHGGSAAAAVVARKCGASQGYPGEPDHASATAAAATAASRVAANPPRAAAEAGAGAELGEEAAGVELPPVHES